MSANLALGLVQGILPPHARPDRGWLASLGATPSAAAGLWPAATSASAMWAANAATVSPAPDTSDGRCHLTVANLVTMPHRAHEWPETLAQLRLAFADERYFTVHEPIPAPFGDEGAANHMRLAPAHDAPGVEVFVYGEPGGPFPARQDPVASNAVVRLHGLDPERTLMVRQSPEAIAAGAFHNDVVAVANETVLLAHEQAFAGKDPFFVQLRERLPGVTIIEVPASAVSLEEAVASYLFNAQLVTLAEGGMALILPSEAQRRPGVGLARAAGREQRPDPQARAGGGTRIDGERRRSGLPAFTRRVRSGDGRSALLVDAAKLDRISAVIAAHWPERVEPGEFDTLGDWPAAVAARRALLETLDLVGLIDR